MVGPRSGDGRGCGESKRRLAFWGGVGVCVFGEGSQELVALRGPRPQRARRGGSRGTFLADRAGCVLTVWLAGRALTRAEVLTAAKARNTMKQQQQQQAVLLCTGVRAGGFLRAGLSAETRGTASQMRAAWPRCSRPTRSLWRGTGRAGLRWGDPRSPECPMRLTPRQRGSEHWRLTESIATFRATEILPGQERCGLPGNRAVGARPNPRVSAARARQEPAAALSEWRAKRRRRKRPALGLPLQTRRRLGPSVRECNYLVDPASSHMLVSKIKPCMCQYRPILRQNREWLIKPVMIH